MRKLFPRIFLTISLAVLAAFAVGIGIAAWARPMLFARSVAQPSPSPPTGIEANGKALRGRMWPGDRLVAHAHAVEWLLTHEGFEAAKDYVDTLRRGGVEALLLSEQATETPDRDAPAPLSQLARRAVDSDEIVFGDHRETLSVAVSGRAPDGNLYVFAAEVPRPDTRIGTYRLWKNSVTLAPVIITLGVVCYVVARYVSSPVLKLRKAVRRFTEGDLDHRVGPAIGRRRDELGELGRDFDQMAERLAAVLSAQRRLLRDISHELQSPLTRQAVALEIARRDAGTTGQDALDRAGREAERLSELVDELLTLTRLESDAQGFERSPVELDELVREIAEDADFEARSRDRSVRLTKCTPCVTVGVPELLRRAVENVVRNAVAYTAAGTEVDVSLEALPSGALVRVRDRGPGVPEAELGEIFRAFYRIGPGRERQTGGVGLGLAITQRAVLAHGGEVSARNGSDGGLVVEIRLPATGTRDHAQ